MEFELKSIYKNEDTGEQEIIDVVNLPDFLPSTIGEKAEQKLNVKIDREQEGKAKVSINTEDFSKVKSYLVKTMLNKYTDKDFELENIAKESTDKIAKYYFDKLKMVGKKKASKA